ncbi:hypothetical protein AB6818_07915 [Carnobacterium maltaromaticum]|uniref:hypothetical protein n=1 Tax=Carnobacterium maltaromaticum TaxID=2751 RepID=UPI0039BEC3FA
MNFNKSALSTLMIFSMVFLSLFGLRASSVKADKLPNGNWEIKDGDTLSEIGLQTGLSVDIIRLLTRRQIHSFYKLVMNLNYKKVRMN